MKNFKQPGNNLEVAAPYDRSSGEAFQLGSLFLVASMDVLSGAQVNGARVGVYSLKKLLADVVSAGDKLNWDDTAKQLKLAAGDLDAVATAVKSASGTDQNVEVVLTPV